MLDTAISIDEALEPFQDNSKPMEGQALVPPQNDEANSPSQTEISVSMPQMPLSASAFAIGDGPLLNVSWPSPTTSADSLTRTRANLQQPNIVQSADIPESSRNPPPASIPVGYPYNLLISVVPSSPRTIRRQVLSTELPESLRRNLLSREWYDNDDNLPAMSRGASGGGSQHSVLSELQRLNASMRMVQVHPRGTVPPVQENPPVDLEPDPDLAEIQPGRRGRAIARNKSWANQYHTEGW